jgi:Rrf2 family cysteine metabolism transcriptional repressor
MKMKVSTKTRYGLRAMIELAESYKGEPVKVKKLLKDKIYQKNILNIFMLQLKKAGLIESIPGAKGGFILTKNPEEIKIIDIVFALEGNLSPVSCVENEKICNLSKACIAREIWKGLKDKMLEYLSSIKLSDVLIMNKEKKKEMIDYQI